MRKSPDHQAPVIFTSLGPLHPELSPDELYEYLDPSTGRRFQLVRQFDDGRELSQTDRALGVENVGDSQWLLTELRPTGHVVVPGVDGPLRRHVPLREWREISRSPRRTWNAVRLLELMWDGIAETAGDCRSWVQTDEDWSSEETAYESTACWYELKGHCIRAVRLALATDTWVVCDLREKFRPLPGCDLAEGWGIELAALTRLTASSHRGAFEYGLQQLADSAAGRLRATIILDGDALRIDIHAPDDGAHCLRVEFPDGTTRGIGSTQAVAYFYLPTGRWGRRSDDDGVGFAADQVMRRAMSDLYGSPVAPCWSTDPLALVLPSSWNADLADDA